MANGILIKNQAPGELIYRTCLTAQGLARTKWLHRRPGAFTCAAR